jgi:hypothetical protein
MPEFTGGQPEDYYAQHKELAGEQKAAQDKANTLQSDLIAEKKDYDERRSRGDRDAAEYRPYETGYAKEILQAQDKADDSQKLIDAQANLGKAHFEVNEEAYRQQAADLDAQGIQDIANKHRGEDE